MSEMIAKESARRVLQYALDLGADFAELFVEDRDDVSIQYAGAVDGVSCMHVFGAGLYMLRDVKSAYVYTNSLTESALRDCVQKGAALLGLSGSLGGLSVQPLRSLALDNPCPVRVYPGTVSHAEKIRVLREADAAARDVTPALRSIRLMMADQDQRITVINTEGLWAEDRRVTGRIRCYPVLSNGRETISTFTEFVSPSGFEMYETGTHIQRIQNAIRDMAGALDAREAPSASVPVILEAGGCTGTFFHEACGHQLETAALQHGGMFWDKRGEQVASDKVTLVDDGSMPGLYGSSRIDDEGMPRQKNVLIENGILKGYLVDRMGARRLNLARTGSGRRQDYAHAPGPRMSNTYLAAGQDDDDEMLRDLDEGLYVTEIGGGTGGREFTLLASTAYWVRHGEILCRVKGAMLTGRGDETMKLIDRVGKRFVTEEGGGSYCGADSGFCATTTSGPRMRIARMIVGGKGGRL